MALRALIFSPRSHFKSLPKLYIGEFGVYPAQQGEVGRRKFIGAHLPSLHGALSAQRISKAPRVHKQRIYHVL